jgi:hypothetical protein
MLRGTNLASIDLTCSRIDGELVIGPSTDTKQVPRWADNSTMRLDHAYVGVIRADFNSWPSHLALDGFDYKGFAQLGKTLQTNQDTEKKLELEQILSWLKKADFHPSAYKTIQSVVGKMGFDEYISRIGFEAKDQERKEAWKDRHYGEWFWLSLMYCFIGYGYAPWYALFWVFTFTVIGAFVFHTAAESAKWKMPIGLAFSFDALLPIIKLREIHYKIDLREWQRYYFYFHKIMGYVLASFLVAGLSGLTR